MYSTVELEENSALNSKVWEAAGLRGNDTFPLDNFSYNNSALLDVIFRHVEKTNFSGITVSGGKDLCLQLYNSCNCCSSTEHEMKSAVTDLLTITCAH